jgi:hypothetical protein
MYSCKSLFTIICFSSQLQLEVTVHRFYFITTTYISHYSQFFSHHNYSLKSLFTVCFSHHNYSFEVNVHSLNLITNTVISYYSQFLSHHTYSLKSLFTVFISSQLQLYVTVDSFYLITTKVWSHCHSFYLITTTTFSHRWQIISHHNYSLKSLFTGFVSPDLQFEVNVYIFYLITSTA